MIDLYIGNLQDLIGTPYAHGARGPRSYDCWGLCAEVYRRAGITLPDYRVEHLTHAQTTDLIKNLARDHAEWIERPEAWCFVYDPRDGHIGLYWHGYVLHCSRGHGTKLERLDVFRGAHPRVMFARWLP